MNRLQKKCFIAAAGSHLLVLVVVLCSGFITTQPQVDNSQVLDMIPSKVIDEAFTSGKKSAQPPPPAPDPIQPPQPPVPPVQAQPPTPAPKPPELAKPVVKPPEPAEPEDTKPAELPEPKPKPKPKHEIKLDLKPVIRNTPTENAATEAKEKAEAQAKAEAKAEALEAKRESDRRAKALRAINNALTAIKSKASSSTEIDMPGSSTAAYANYASVVKTVYTEAWRLPDTTESDDANVKVSVTIANDGRVVQSHIVDPSGDSSVDRSVQRALDRVTHLEPFPDGATDKERTYIINFNLKAKRQMLG